MLVLKDVLRPRLKLSSSRGGGEEFQPDKYLTDSDAFLYKSRAKTTLDLV